MYESPTRSEASLKHQFQNYGRISRPDGPYVAAPNNSSDHSRDRQSAVVGNTFRMSNYGVPSDGTRDCNKIWRREYRLGSAVMDSERWRRIEELYHRALERAANQRAAFLCEACESDDELRREVE